MENEDELFIAEIKATPAIYNTRHVCYGITDYRQKIWKKLDQKFKWKNLAKKKWKDLRDRYVKDKKRRNQIRSKRSASFPQWKLFPLLEFLNEHLRTYTSKTTINQKSTNKEIKDENLSDDEMSQIEDELENIETKSENDSKENIVEKYEELEQDPFVYEINMDHKCGQIFIENENILIVCDFCENIFNEIHAFKYHIINFHTTKEQTKSKINVNDEEEQEEEEENFEFIEDQNQFIDELSITSTFDKETDDIFENSISSKNEKILPDTLLEIDLTPSTNVEDSTKIVLKPTGSARPKHIQNKFGKFECSQCDKSYEKYASVSDHFRHHHATINECELCNEKFDSKQATLTHYKKIHNIYEKKIGSDEIFIAEDLLKIKNTNEIPLVPPRIRNKDDRFVCLVCNNSYTRHDSLRKHHKAMHLTQQQTIQCEHCNKIFQNKYQLDIHMYVHNKLRPYKCTKCHSDFSHPKYLAVHLRHHLGKKRYPCEFCTETFSKKIDKILHHRINHTKEKPYSCTNCNETFTKYSQLVVHNNRKHNPDKPKPIFQCERCSKTFNRRDTLTSHLRAHENIRPFQCDICRTKFVSNSSLRFHEKKVHDRYRIKVNKT